MFDKRNLYLIVSPLDLSKYSVYSDIPGFTVGGGSIPPELCITAQKPDIVIEDKKNKNIHLFELPFPLARNIETRHTEKSNRYAHFLTDMRNDYTCLVTAFEIGSLGYISPRNHSSLYTLHKFLKPGIKLALFKKNLSALSVYSSYYIFITRKEPLFNQPPFLLPPFKDQ